MLPRYELNQRLGAAIEDLAQKIERRVFARLDVARAETSPMSVRVEAVAAAEQALHTAGTAVNATTVELSDTILDVAEHFTAHGVRA